MQQRIGHRYGATSAQVALAALLAKPQVMVIPQSHDPRRIAENWHAQDLRITEDDLAEIDAAFPVPRNKRPPAMRQSPGRVWFLRSARARDPPCRHR